MAINNKKSLPELMYPTPKIIFWVAVLAIAGYGLFFVVKQIAIRSGYFKVEFVKFSGNRYQDEKNIQSFAKVDLNQSIFDVNLAYITDKMLENPYLRGVSVSRILPSSILIDVQEREPILYLADQSVYMVDETGMVLQKLPRMLMGKLPIITGLSKKAIEKDSTAILAAIQLVRKIREVDASLVSFISEINFRDQKTPELVLVKGAARVKLGTTDYYQRIYLLSELLSKQPIMDRLPTIRTIDLTFADRVIVQNKS